MLVYGASWEARAEKMGRCRLPSAFMGFLPSLALWGPQATRGKKLRKSGQYQIMKSNGGRNLRQRLIFYLRKISTGYEENLHSELHTKILSAGSYTEAQSRTPAFEDIRGIFVQSSRGTSRYSIRPFSGRLRFHCSMFQSFKIQIKTRCQGRRRGTRWGIIFFSYSWKILMRNCWHVSLQI